VEVEPLIPWKFLCNHQVHNVVEDHSAQILKRSVPSGEETVILTWSIPQNSLALA